jgi:hypothetical protein
MEKLFLTPDEYSKRSGLKIDHVRWLCRTGKLECVTTPRGGYYKIPLRALLEYGRNSDSPDTGGSYEALVKENERLKTKLNMILNIASKDE